MFAAQPQLSSRVMAYGNSAHAHLQRDMISHVDDIHDIPDGVTLPEGSQQIWEYLMRSRHYDDWFETDLLIAAKIVRYEVTLREGYARLDQFLADGADPFDVESIASSYLSQISKVEKAQLALIRSLGFTRGCIISTSVTKRASNQAEYNNAAAQIHAITDGLSMLAQ